MYHYLDDKEFQHKMRALSGEIMQKLCHYLKEDYDIGASFCLVGSGARNLILQNNDNPVDLDYNLEISRCEDFDDCRYIKECVMKSFNKSLRIYGLWDCSDSTSVLTTKQISICLSNNMNLLVRRTINTFSIDVCITKRDRKDNQYRLIHEKTCRTSNDKYYWNIAPKSAQLKKKAKYIKECGKWQLVRQQYLDIKNEYLTRNDHNHPSFVCYIEAVNNVYNARKHW